MENEKLKMENAGHASVAPGTAIIFNFSFSNFNLFMIALLLPGGRPLAGIRAQVTAAREPGVHEHPQRQRQEQQVILQLEQIPFQDNVR